MMSEEAFEARLQERRAKRMARVDAMSSEMRACVHDYGLRVVDSFMDCGVKKPKHLRHLVKMVLDELSPLGVSGSLQGGPQFRRGQE